MQCTPQLIDKVSCTWFFFISLLGRLSEIIILLLARCVILAVKSTVISPKKVVYIQHRN